MPAELMYGQPVADQIDAQVRAEAAAFKKAHNVIPRLDVVQVGKSPASQRYVAKKLEACERLGICGKLHLFDDEVSGAQLYEHVLALSADRNVHGILVQLPLPMPVEEARQGEIGKFEIFDAIAAEKDVDGVGRYSVPALYRAQQHELMFLPCTPLGVLRMLAYYKIETKGKVAVVVGRNDITAKPMHHILGGRICNATAIWAHRYTRKEDHDAFMRQADIIVTSVGNASYRITADLLKPGAVVIDVGTRIDPEGKLKGDADASVRAVASFVTPVPKGVGPVTVAALGENVIRAAKFVWEWASAATRFEPRDRIAPYAPATRRGFLLSPPRNHAGARLLCRLGLFCGAASRRQSVGGQQSRPAPGLLPGQVLRGTGDLAGDSAAAHRGACAAGHRAG